MFYNHPSDHSVTRGNTVGVATIILNPNDLVRTLCSIIVSSDVVKIVGHSLDIVTCIVTSEPAHQLLVLNTCIILYNYMYKQYI